FGERSSCPNPCAGSIRFPGRAPPAAPHRSTGRRAGYSTRPKTPPANRSLSAIVSRTGRDKKFRPIEGEDWQALIRYNIVDVLLLAAVHAELQHYDQEPELLRADETINERGVCVDTLLAQRILRLAEAETARLASEAERLTCGAVKTTDLNRTA